MEIVEPFEPQDVAEDVHKLAQRLLFYSQNRQSEVDQSAKRQRYVMDRFSMQRMVENYTQCYESATLT